MIYWEVHLRNNLFLALGLSSVSFEVSRFCFTVDFKVWGWCTGAGNTAVENSYHLVPGPNTLVAISSKTLIQQVLQFFTGGAG